jgi:hypothetical protein
MAAISKVAASQWCWHPGAAEARSSARMPGTILAMTWRDGEHEVVLDHKQVPPSAAG